MKAKIMTKNSKQTKNKKLSIQPQAFKAGLKKVIRGHYFSGLRTLKIHPSILARTVFRASLYL